MEGIIKKSRNIEFITILSYLTITEVITMCLLNKSCYEEYWGMFFTQLMVSVVGDWAVVRRSKASPYNPRILVITEDYLSSEYYEPIR